MERRRRENHHAMFNKNSSELASEQNCKKAVNWNERKRLRGVPMHAWRSFQRALHWKARGRRHSLMTKKQVARLHSIAPYMEQGESKWWIRMAIPRDLSLLYSLLHPDKVSASHIYASPIRWPWRPIVYITNKKNYTFADSQFADSQPTGHLVTFNWFSHQFIKIWFTAC